MLQCNEVKNSANMENEGLQQIIEELTRKGCKVKVLITDRHKQNELWIKINMKVAIISLIFGTLLKVKF